MSHAKPASTKSAKPQMAAARSKSTPSAGGSQPKSGAIANALLEHSVAPMTAEMRRMMIAEAAYYIAAQRGFGDGHALEDWLLAEQQIDAALAA
jgi:Protein of unknown function (DUF2934)